MTDRYEPLSFAICDHCNRTYPYERDWCHTIWLDGKKVRWSGCGSQLRHEGPKPNIKGFDAIYVGRLG